MKRVRKQYRFGNRGKNHHPPRIKRGAGRR
jgi:hypothetical protein